MLRRTRTESEIQAEDDAAHRAIRKGLGVRKVSITICGIYRFASILRVPLIWNPLLVVRDRAHGFAACRGGPQPSKAHGDAGSGPGSNPHRFCLRLDSNPGLITP